jgi:hypothetical protein
VKSGIEKYHLNGGIDLRRQVDEDTVLKGGREHQSIAEGGNRPGDDRLGLGGLEASGAGGNLLSSDKLAVRAG